MAVLRWLAVLPASLGGAYLAWLGTTLVGRLDVWFLRPGPESLHAQMVTHMFPNIFLGMAFVAGGITVAPSSKAKVAAVLALLMVVGAGLLAWHFYGTGQWWFVAGSLAMIVGAVVGAVGRIRSRSPAA